MKTWIVESVIGIFGFEEDGSLVGSVPFPKDVEKIADKLKRIRVGETVEELVDLVTRLKEMGYDRFVFESAGLAKRVREELGVEVDVEKSSRAAEVLRRSLGVKAVEIGYVARPEEVTQLLHNVSISLAKTDVKRAVEKRDQLAVQAVLALDDFDRTLNLFSNRLREWYGLHFPELGNLVEDQEAFLRLIADLGDRSNFDEECLEKLGFPKDKAKKILRSAEASMGAVIAANDIEQIRLISRETLELHKARENIEKYVDETMSTVAQNIQALVGSTLGARLIAAAGGLEGLASKPSSTIQVLGAEKALFRSLKTGSKPPKHGFIFQHPQIRQAPWWQRGKIARALAGRLAIAARVDAFSGEYIGDRLRADFEKRVEEIREKYAEPVVEEGRRDGRKGSAA